MFYSIYELVSAHAYDISLNTTPSSIPIIDTNKQLSGLPYGKEYGPGFCIFYKMSLCPRAEEPFNQRPHFVININVPGDSVSVIPIE